VSRKARAEEDWDLDGLLIFFTVRADRRSNITGCHFDLCLDNWLPTSRVKKPLLDLRRNVLQPLLGTTGSILIVTDIRLEIIYLVMGGSKLIMRSSKLIVGGSKLIRKFLSDLSRLLEVCRSRGCRPANQPKNSVPCPVHYLGLRTRTFVYRSIRNNGRRICNLISHRNLLTPTACRRYFSIQIRASAIWPCG
jgi:hypothetical protein